MNIFSVLRGSCHTKNIWLLSKPRQRSDSGNLPMDFLAFIEQTRKENNTYFIDLLIIENVELERVLWRECFIFRSSHHLYSIFLSRVKMNSINWPAPNIWVFIAQLVEHCSANAEAMGSNPVEALKFFSGLNSQLLKLRL